MKKPAAVKAYHNYSLQYNLSAYIYVSYHLNCNIAKYCFHSRRYANNKISMQMFRKKY